MVTMEDSPYAFSTGTILGIVAFGRLGSTALPLSSRDDTDSEVEPPATKMI